MDKTWLPSRKLVLSLGALAMVLVGGFLLSKDVKTFLLGGENKEFLFVSNEVKEKSDIDTDSDGLKDWEEVLWGTDINKIDSDGEGTGDSEEVGDSAGMG